MRFPGQDCHGLKNSSVKCSLHVHILDGVSQMVILLWEAMKSLGSKAYRRSPEVAFKDAIQPLVPTWFPASWSIVM